MINRAMNENISNNIERNENGEFIDDGERSVRIEIEMITIEETFSMEWIYDRGMMEFVGAFNFVTFESVEVEHHRRTGRISRMVFRQLDE